MQIATTTEGEELEFDFDETLAELIRVLPDRHPLIERVGNLFESAGEHLEDFANALAEERRTPWRAMAESLVGALDDWKRGVRDWSEVEEQLAAPRSWMEEQQ